MFEHSRRRRRLLRLQKSESLELRTLLTPVLRIVEELNAVGNDEYKLIVDDFHMGTVEETPAGVTQFRGNPDRFQRDPLTGDENGFGATELFGLYVAGFEVDATGGRIDDVRIHGELFEIEASGVIPASGGSVGTWNGVYTVSFDALAQSVVFSGSVIAEFSQAVTGDLNIGRLSSNHVQLADNGSVVQTGDVRFPIVFDYETAGGPMTESWDPVPTDPEMTDVGSFPDIESFATTVTFPGDINISDPLQDIRKPSQKRTVTSVGDDVHILGGAVYTYEDNTFDADNMGGSHLTKLDAWNQPLTFSTLTIWTPAHTSTVSLPASSSPVTEADNGLQVAQIPVAFTYDETRMDTIEPFSVSYAVTSIQDGTRHQGTLQFTGTEAQQTIPVAWTADTVPGPDRVFQIEILAVDSPFVRPDVWVTELLVTDDDVPLVQISGRVFHDVNADGFRTTASLAALGLTIDSRGTYFNAFDQQEHWLRTDDAEWVALLPDGRIVQWDRTPEEVSGPVIAQIDPRVHSNPVILTQHTPENGMNGITVELLDAFGHVIQSTESSDIDLDNDGTPDSGVYRFDVVAGTYSVRVMTADDLASSPGIADSQAKRVYDLDSAREFEGGHLFENWGGLGEKWLSGTTGWHYVTPDGGVYRWDPQTRSGNLDGELIDRLPATWYHQIDLLFAAENPLMSLQAGEQKTVDAGVYQPATIAGLHFDDANANGRQDPEESTVNGTMVRLSLPNGVTIAVAETSDLDIDGNGTIDPMAERGLYEFRDLIPGRYLVDFDLPEGHIRSEIVGPQPVLAYHTQQYHQLATSGNLFENWGGRGERWLFGRGGWYFLTPDGRLWQWDDRSGTDGTPLTGQFQIQLDPFYYSSIEFLYDAVDPVLRVRSGETVQRPLLTTNAR
ncbi:MAG: SdrD B-like domain-containing protein [Planctomycetaceae bacterium]